MTTVKLKPIVKEKADEFARGICKERKLTKGSKSWSDCYQRAFYEFCDGVHNKKILILSDNLMKTAMAEAEHECLMQGFKKGSTVFEKCWNDTFYLTCKESLHSFTPSPDLLGQNPSARNIPEDIYEAMPMTRSDRGVIEKLLKILGTSGKINYSVDNMTSSIRSAIGTLTNVYLQIRGYNTNRTKGQASSFENVKSGYSNVTKSKDEAYRNLLLKRAVTAYFAGRIEAIFMSKKLDETFNVYKNQLQNRTIWDEENVKQGRINSVKKNKQNVFVLKAYGFGKGSKIDLNSDQQDIGL